eukprot:4619135-Alexandrium_andersonii.AAC.1
MASPAPASSPGFEGPAGLASSCCSPPLAGEARSTRRPSSACSCVGLKAADDEASPAVRDWTRTPVLLP